MTIVALMTVRNEIRYLDRCLSHLHKEGVDVCVIDNDSSDGTQRLARDWLGRGVIRVEHLTFNGYFDLTAILRNEERLAKEIPADWFLHHDADEIRESPEGFGRLAEALCRVDREGCDSVDFNEFIFVPADGETHESGNYVETMRRYYFFEPSKLRRVNAWKKTGQAVDLVSSGGHQVRFGGQKIYPVPFVLRHYPVLSRRHLIEKYSRPYSPDELEKGWHHPLNGPLVRWPEADRLKVLGLDGRWDKSDPWRRHPYFE